MSEQTPRKGDKVRWTSVIEGVVEDFFPGEIHINDGGDDPVGNVRVLPMGEASVEVLERADDPSKDAVGTLRRQPPGGSEEGNASALGVVAIRWATERQTDTPWVYFRWDGPQVLSNESVVGWELAGSLPTSATESSGLVTFVAPADWRLQLDGADPAYLLESWQVSGPAEAEQPYSITLVMPCGHDTTEHGPVCPSNVELPDLERVSSAPERAPLLCGARWDGVRSCEHEPNHDGKHGFFRSPDAGWFEWTSSREVV